MTTEIGTPPECPTCECGALMSRRVNKRGAPFWGCTRWPECTGLIDIVEPTEPSASMPAKPDDFRRNAALEILKTLLLCPEARQSLWTKYMVDRSETRLAVDIADDLTRELERTT